ncbi:MAG: Ig-like domain-containing protein, partial [Actinomycetota bacterium]
PNQLLVAGSAYTVQVTNGVTDIVGLALSNPQSTSFTIGTKVDNVRPSIVTYSPYGSQGNVPLSARVEVVFDEAIDVSRLNSQSVVVQNWSTGDVVPGTLMPTADRKGLVFTPNQPLAANSFYMLFIGTGSGTIYDLAGNPLLNPVSYSRFDTGITLADTVAPQVTAVNPKDGSSGFALNGVIEMQFSKPISPTSVSDQTIVVSAGGVPVAGEVGFRNNNTIVTFKPANLVLWNASTNYMVQVTNNVRDLSGNAALPFNSVFTTGTASDTVSPTIVSVVPASGGTIDPDLPAAFTVTFSEPIDPVSLAGGLVVARGSYPNSAEAWMSISSVSLSLDQKVLTIQADKPVVAGRYVSLFFNSGLRDIAGNGFTACGACAWESTQWSAPADPSTVFDSATVSVNPTALYADGQSTTQITISGISKGGVLVPNGTQVAVTVAPIYRTDSVGGTILEGTVSPHDSRIKILTTLGGKVSFTYQSVNLPSMAPGQTVNSFVQVAPVDALGRPNWSVNNTAIQLYRGKTAAIGVNPANLLANGTSYGNISITVSDNTGTPLPAGTPVGVTVDKVYQLSSLGGTLSGGVPSTVVAQDTRVKVYEVQPGGVINLTYTTPVLAAGQSGNAYVQVVEVNNAGLVTGLMGVQGIVLNGSSGSTHPQPVLSYTTPANGQWNVGRNAPIVMVFSQSLDPVTVNSGTIWNYQGVAGSFALSSGPGGPNSVVTFTPSPLLGASQNFNFYISTSVKAADGQPLLAGYSFAFSTGATVDTTAPTVTAFNPANGMTAAPLNSTLRVQFSEG